ncbi:MAG: hypothetical protein GXP00_11065 [Alphaproteobacteria bacterium]|nr:hypothetical protein [Alphaproteobacteria bacterium]
MNITEHDTIPTDTTQDKPTYGKGYIFLFRDGDNEIEVFGSAISGKETVRYNDEIVSDIRSFGFTTHHLFKKGDDNYKVTFAITSLLRGGIACSLYKNGTLMRQEEQIMYKGSGVKLMGIMAVFLGLGVIVGYSSVSLVEAFVKWIG